MTNVRKRTRSGGAKLELKWCDSLTPHQQLQEGRSICFRVADTGTGVFEFYCIPFDFDDDSDSQPKNQKNDEPPPLPTGILPFQENGEIPWLSTFAAVGSSLFCFGGKKTGEFPLSSFYRCDDDDDTTGGIRGRWYTNSSFDMIHARCQPQIIAMGGNLLVIGGLWKNWEDGSSWAEVFDPCSNLSSPAASLPNELQPKAKLVTAALRSSNQILVASTFSNAAFVCDVRTLVWDVFDQSDQFVFGKGTVSHFRDVQGEAAVVKDTILCWFHFRGNLLHAYDLKLKMWFEKPITGLKKVCKIMSDLYDNDFSLLPLDYDHICLLLFDHSPYGAQTCYSVFHCIKVLVSINCTGERPIFKASVISFRSYLLKKMSLHFIEAVVL
ncbi:hypothetical protein RHSIM_Rhsim06G0070500 [Rhododendron simsii]|uniref:Uncharacterized protein n=1 Tax=Rhododendron simsii TaxID=118357 RepID=A0A834GU60_RHOSS|nr:hypothetical protein RHSIM_Rhsim06G0070500 [Rhododendron simsii]